MDEKRGNLPQKTWKHQERITMSNLFSKILPGTKKIKTTPESTTQDPDLMEPKNPDDFMERGWLYYSQKKYDQAVADFNRVLQDMPYDVDTWYTLGLTFKALGDTQKAVDAFNKIDAIIGGIDDPQRAMIVTRLAHGQVNQIKTGNWNLEKEVWQRKS